MGDAKLHAAASRTAADRPATSSTAAKSTANAAVSNATDAAAESAPEFQPDAEQRATAALTNPKQQSKPTNKSKSGLWKSRILRITLYFLLYCSSSADIPFLSFIFCVQCFLSSFNKFSDFQK